MKTLRKIVMFCSWFPNRVQPTNGNFAEKHIRLIAQKNEVTVFQVEYDPALSFLQNEWIEKRQDNYYLLTVYFGNPFGRLFRFLHRLILCWRAYSFLEKRRGEFDLLHVHVAMPGAILGYFLSKIKQLPFVLSCHSSGFLASSPRAYFYTQRRLLMFFANAAKFVCPVSNALAISLQNNGLTAPIKVIPNVVNTQMFYPAEESIPEVPFKLLHISNFHPQAKNVKGILRVAKKLCDQDLPFQLTIAGDGDLTALKNYGEALVLNKEKVIFYGTLSELEVAKMMRAHHVFVLFSNYETQGVTLLEAQCSGLSIIATNVGGIPEILAEDWMGVMVEVGDENALFEAIENAILNGVNKYGSSISKYAKRRYSEDYLGQLFSEIY